MHSYRIAFVFLSLAVSANADVERSGFLGFSSTLAFDSPGLTLADPSGRSGAGASVGAFLSSSRLDFWNSLMPGWCDCAPGLSRFSLAFSSVVPVAIGTPVPQQGGLPYSELVSLSHAFSRWNYRHHLTNTVSVGMLGADREGGMDEGVRRLSPGERAQGWSSQSRWEPALLWDYDYRYNLATWWVRNFRTVEVAPTFGLHMGSITCATAGGSVRLGLFQASWFDRPPSVLIDEHTFDAWLAGTAEAVLSLWDYRSLGQFRDSPYSASWSSFNIMTYRASLSANIAVGWFNASWKPYGFQSELHRGAGWIEGSEFSVGIVSPF